MGDVYLALHVGPGGVAKIVVVKELRVDFASADSARQMFLNEARIATRLNHPNIVQTMEVIEEQEDLYIVMESLDGQPLSRLLKTSHSATLTQAARIRILVKALEGLHYVHELEDYDGRPLGAVHRDVSPQNIIVTYNGHVKLVDFGVAKASDATTMTASGVFKGKARYASPEQALCAKVDRRADIFAVGTILWEMLAGKRMWAGHTDATVLFALASGKLPSLREAWPEVPPVLEAICAKALATDVNARYATALEFRHALVEYLRTKHEPEVDLSTLLLNEFGGDRQKLHTLIDGQVRSLREQSTGTITARPPSQTGSAPLSERSFTRGALAVEPMSQMDVSPGRSKARRRMAFAGIAAALAATAGVALLGPGRLANAPATAPLSADTTVHLSLRASPPSVRILLDGVPVSANPYEADVPRGDSKHHVSIRADGFEARELDVAFSRDVTLNESLSPTAPLASNTPAPPPASDPTVSVGNVSNAWVRRSVPAATPPTRGPRKGSAPQRQIDEEDPYKR